MAFMRVNEDLEIIEDIRHDEGIAAHHGHPKAEDQKQKNKIPKKVKIKDFLKFIRKSKFEGPLTPTALIEMDFNATNDIGNSSEDPEVEHQQHKIRIFDKMKTLMKRKKTSNSPGSPSGEKLEIIEDRAGSSGGHEVERQKHEHKKIRRFDKMKNAFITKKQRNTKSCATPSGNFGLEPEERVFGSNEGAEDQDYDVVRLRMVIYDSFSEDNQETLIRALNSILQKEKQVRQCNDTATDEHPIWSPEKLGQIKTVLKTVVEERLKNADEQENKADKLSTSLTREVCRMGKQVQKDLLRVVRDLRECYPEDFDICRTYAQLYHQTFSSRLQELTRSSIDFEECLYILNWIKDYYPKYIVKHKELEEHVSCLPLEPLLPEEDLERLEEQYFLHKENEVTKWLSNALEKEVKKWNDGIKPQLMDGYYFSHLAVDVLPLVDVTVSEVKALLGCENKAWSLLKHLDDFLLSYKTSLEKFVNRKPKNTAKILFANLADIQQFRDYVQKTEHLFSLETRIFCLSTLKDIKNMCHTFFLSRIHTKLKPVYRKLWTQVWFAGHCEVMEELEKELQSNIDDFKELKPVCREELLVELHVEVMVEYVRRMMKRKLKLENKEQQEAAAELICHDSNIICSMFSKVGSKEEWLCQILIKLSEILRLQDLGSLQLEIATLARDYPDLRNQHVIALLNLKTSLSSSDLYRIEECLIENRSRQETESSICFFAKVRIDQEPVCVPFCSCK